MDLFQIAALALLQGLTEFLPISSSAHLILLPHLGHWADQGPAFDVAVHIGTLAAVVWYFRHELLRTLRSFTTHLGGGGIDADARLAWAVILGTVPLVVAGLAVELTIADALRGPLVIAAATLLFGLLLGWADRVDRGGRDEYSLGWRDVAIIGLAQALALIPGTSRSGITMTAALMLGLSREGAARFSFLLSIPAILAAGTLKSAELILSEAPTDWGAMLLGALLSGASAYLCIHWFLKLLERIGFMPFVAYRLALGGVLLWLYW